MNSLVCELGVLKIFKINFFLLYHHTRHHTRLVQRASPRDPLTSDLATLNYEVHEVLEHCFRGTS